MSRFPQSPSSRQHVLTALAAAGALAAAALLGTPAVATAAQPAAAVPQLTVHYSYRDLATDQGTRALYERITLAARAVCPTYDPRDLDAFAASQQCQREAVARAVGEVGNGRLAAVYSRAHAHRG